MSDTHELKAKIVEKPMLFSGPMVRAILDGRKTQTRRIVKFRKFNIRANDIRWLEGKAGPEIYGAGGVWLDLPIPHPIGSLVWVRETWYDDLRDERNILQKDDHIYYRADGECCTQIPECSCKETGPTPWRPSIHMPRWASRITLEITDVRVQRLRDISEEDALAEGVDKLDFYTLLNRSCHNGGLPRGIKIDPPYVRDFSKMWNRINGDGAWDQNPWVFAYTFKKLEASHE